MYAGDTCPLKCGENATISLTCTCAVLALAKIAITVLFDGVIDTLAHSPDSSGRFLPGVSVNTFV